MLIAVKEVEQSNNCLEVVDSYFDGKLDKQKVEGQVVSEMPISLVENTNQGDEELMKNIILRSDGRYMGRKQVNGIRVTVYAYTVKQCLEKLKKAIKDAIKNPKVKKETYKLYDWLDNWYETYKARFVTYKSGKIIENAILEIKKGFDNINLNDLTSNKIQQFLNQYQTSRKKEFITLYFNASLQKAEDISLIAKNPFKAVVRDKKLNNIREPFSYPEQEKIINALKGTEIEPVILFYLCTGIRKNELNTKNLINDIDTNRHILKVKSEKKRGKEIFREIDITDSLINLVKNNPKSFTLTTNQVYRKFKQILDSIGVEGSIHNLRHTFATNHYYLGTPAKQVQIWLGHEKIELTQNIYTHIDRTITKKDILKLYNNLYYQI